MYGLKDASATAEQRTPEPCPSLPCFCTGHGFTDETCICTDQERWARHLAYGRGSAPALPAEERAAWIAEIAGHEGQPEAAYYQGRPDKDVALDLLGAWQDYCRDKGLL